MKKIECQQKFSELLLFGHFCFQDNTLSAMLKSLAWRHWTHAFSNQFQWILLLMVFLNFLARMLSTEEKRVILFLYWCVVLKILWKKKCWKVEKEDWRTFFFCMQNDNTSEKLLRFTEIWVNVRKRVSVCVCLLNRIWTVQW
jgi:hypothetical protein